MNYCTELFILKFHFQTAREEHTLCSIYECIILNENNASNQNAFKTKMLDKNEATLRNTDKTKTDVHELCGVIKWFNYEKSYADFSVSSKKEVASNFPT